MVDKSHLLVQNSHKGDARYGKAYDMEAQTDVRITVRVDRELKESAEKLFDYLGLNISNAINIFLRKSVDERGIPFPVRVEPANTAGQLSPDAVTEAFVASVDEELKRAKHNGLPVARYDSKSGKAYLEYADGTKEYV
jgi:DNA-damage-inducible protein J